MRDLPIRLYVRGVDVKAEDALPCILLETRDGSTRLELPSGPFEAGSVMMRLGGLESATPMAHDLFADFFRFHGYKLDRVELYNSGCDCRARMSYRKGVRRYEREASPSDALAIALRLECPVFADGETVRRFSSPVATRSKLRLVKGLGNASAS
jgi:hypothetical protein